MAVSEEKKEILDDLARLRIFDDVLLSNVFDRQIPETQFLIRSITGNDDITVVSSEAEYPISNPYRHEARLDIVAFDSDGKAYHFEVQKSKSGASPRRARLTAALLDTTLLEKGREYAELPDRYTIFITEDDYFQKGLPVYRAEYVVHELADAPLGDGSFIWYVNGANRDKSTRLGKLMHDFSCENPDDMLNPLLRDRVRYLKKGKGKESMCDIVENLMDKRSKNDRIECAIDAIAEGKYSLEEIAKLFRLPLSTVQELATIQKKSV